MTVTLFPYVDATEVKSNKKGNLSNELLNENEYLVIRRHVYAHLKLYVHTFTGL